jgi:hypothetical protein
MIMCCTAQVVIFVGWIYGSVSEFEVINSRESFQFYFTEFWLHARKIASINQTFVGHFPDGCIVTVVVCSVSAF